MASTLRALNDKELKALIDNELLRRDHVTEDAFNEHNRRMQRQLRELRHRARLLRGHLVVVGNAAAFQSFKTFEDIMRYANKALEADNIRPKKRKKK